MNLAQVASPRNPRFHASVSREMVRGVTHHPEERFENEQALLDILSRNEMLLRRLARRRACRERKPRNVSAEVRNLFVEANRWRIAGSRTR